MKQPFDNLVCVRLFQFADITVRARRHEACTSPGKGLVTSRSLCLDNRHRLLTEPAGERSDLEMPLRASTVRSDRRLEESPNQSLCSRRCFGRITSRRLLQHRKDVPPHPGKRLSRGFAPGPVSGAKLADQWPGGFLDSGRHRGHHLARPDRKHLEGNRVTGHCSGLGETGPLCPFERGDDPQTVLARAQVAPQCVLARGTKEQRPDCVSPGGAEVTIDEVDIGATATFVEKFDDGVLLLACHPDVRVGGVRIAPAPEYAGDRLAIEQSCVDHRQGDAMAVNGLAPENGAPQNILESFRLWRRGGTNIPDCIGHSPRNRPDLLRRAKAYEAKEHCASHSHGNRK